VGAAKQRPQLPRKPKTFTPIKTRPPFCAKKEKRKNGVKPTILGAKRNRVKKKQNIEVRRKRREGGGFFIFRKTTENRKKGNEETRSPERGRVRKIFGGEATKNTYG